MKVGFLNRIANAAEKKGAFLGGIYGVLQDPISDGRGLSGAPNFMIDRLLNWKVPSDPIGMMTWSLRSEYYSAMKHGVGAAIIGSIIDEIDLHPLLSKAGRIAKNAGVGAALGSVLGAALWLPAATSSPPDPTKYTGQGDNSRCQIIGY